jgi:hypothetical protein
MELRRQGSNLPLTGNNRASFRLDHAGTNSGGSRTRTCERRTAACALATRCLARLGHASEAEGEGVEPPRPSSPPVFETGYRACGSPSRSGRAAKPRGLLAASQATPQVAPAGVEPATARVRTGSSAVVELRSREVWPAGIEPAPPRVSGARSTRLSYDHMVQVGEAGIEPAASCV